MLSSTFPLKLPCSESGTLWFKIVIMADIWNFGFSKLPSEASTEITEALLFRRDPDELSKDSLILNGI